MKEEREYTHENRVERRVPDNTPLQTPKTSYKEQQERDHVYKSKVEKRRTTRNPRKPQTLIQKTHEEELQKNTRSKKTEKHTPANQQDLSCRHDTVSAPVQKRHMSYHRHFRDQTRAATQVIPAMNTTRPTVNQIHRIEDKRYAVPQKKS